MEAHVTHYTDLKKKLIVVMLHTSTVLVDQLQHCVLSGTKIICE